MFTSLDSSQLESYLHLSREKIYKDSFNQLACHPLKQATYDPCFENIRFLKILLISSSSQDLKSQFAALLYALWSLDITLCYILKVVAGTITPYIGISHPHKSRLVLDLLKQGLDMTYDAIQFEEIHDEAVHDLLTRDLFNCENIKSIASATLIPKLSDDTGPLNPLLAPFLKTMNRTSYTLVLLADSLTRTDYGCLYQEELQDIYNTLFPYKDINFTLNEQDTHTSTDTTNRSESENQTVSCSHSDETFCTKSEVKMSQKSLTLNCCIGNDFKPSQFTNCTETITHTNNSKDNHVNSSSNQRSSTNACSHTKTHTCSNIKISSYKSQDIQVSSILDQMQLLLARYEQTANLPIFNLNTYFLSDLPFTAIQAAANYISLLEYKTAPLFPSFLNSWLEDYPSFDPLLESLSHLCLPMFYQTSSRKPFTAALPVTSTELSALLTPLFIPDLLSGNKIKS